MTKPPPPPQLYAIRAAAAPMTVVFAHRGVWFMIARWNFTTNKVERGAWFRGKIFQRRSDVSPDGEFLHYVAMKGGRSFHAVSRVPWLTALALWHADATVARLRSARRREPSRAPRSGLRDRTTRGPRSPLHARRDKAAIAKQAQVRFAGTPIVYEYERVRAST